MANKNLKSLEGEEKKGYLNNLSSAILMTLPLMICESLYDNLNGLIPILHESNSVELDLSNGLPSTMSVLGINTVKKDFKKELEELKSKTSSGFKSEQGEISLEQMLVERIKSKMYSFDTVIAEEMRSEGTPFYEILNTEFVLRDRMYFLKAVEASLFNLDNMVLGNFSAGTGTYIGYFDLIGFDGYFDLIGFDSSQNKFRGYRFDVSFPQKGAKKIFTNYKESPSFRLKPKYEKLLKDNFLTSDMDSIYQTVSGINKHLLLSKVSRIIMGPYADKHTGKVGSLSVPKNFFKDCPEAFVLDVSVEEITTLEEPNEDSKKDKMVETEKSKTVYKFCNEGLPRSKLIDFYKGHKDIKVFGDMENG